MTRVYQLTPGTVLTFAGLQWTLLEPTSGYMIANSSIINKAFDTSSTGAEFNPNRAQSIAYYLNTTFYNTLSTAHKNMLLSKTWGVGPNNNENSKTVTAKIGLLSTGEWRQYSKRHNSTLGILNNPAFQTIWWTRTYSGYYEPNGDYAYTIYPEGHLVDVSVPGAHQIRPTAYIDPNLYYMNGTVTNNTAPIASAIPAQNVRKNTSVPINLANYFSDAEGNTLTYTTSSNNTGIATVAIAGGILTVTGRSVGNVVITVIASDGSLSTSQTFAVTVANTGPVGTTMPSQTTKKNSSVAVNLANYFSDVDHDALIYTASSANTNIATVSVSGNILTISGVSTGSSLITVTASDSKLTASQSFITTVTNSVPTVTVTAPAVNVTLYENDLFNLAGQASDIDANQSVTVYAQINDEQRIVLAVGLSNAPVTFNKALKFAGGQLLDGETAITGNLTDGIAHQLKIWAQDGDGAQSAISQRTFYVVPNRPPLITVDTIVPNGIIDADVITISGTAGDPDNNQITAAYRINNGNSVPIEITAGVWLFDVPLAQLTVGQNTIVVEVVDTYHSKVSKTIKLNKNEVKTPILHSVARYKIEPPKGSAKGVLLYLQRDEDLTDLTVELSMVIQGEQENYVPLTADNTAPISEGIVEDEFYFEADEAKNHIILKLSTTRPDVSIDHKIHLISGVLE